MPKGRIVPLAIVGVLLLAGCSSGGEQTASRDDDQEEIRAELVEDGPAQVQADNAETGFDETITPASEVLDRQPIVFQRFESDGNELTLFFEMETQSCFGLQIEHTETDNAVEVGLWTGLLLPDVDAEDCGIGVYSYHTVIELDEPLGDREVVPAAPSSGSTSSGSPPSESEIGTDIVDAPSAPQQEELEVRVDEDGQADPAQFIGLTIEEATDLADGNSYLWHVAKIDGEPTISTPPADQHFVFEIEDELVVAADIS